MYQKRQSGREGDGEDKKRVEHIYRDVTLLYRTDTTTHNYSFKVKDPKLIYYSFRGCGDHYTVRSMKKK